MPDQTKVVVVNTTPLIALTAATGNLDLLRCLSTQGSLCRMNGVLQQKRQESSCYTFIRQLRCDLTLVHRKMMLLDQIEG